MADEPATPPKKADLAALPDDVLRTHIFQFSALQKENEFLRAEVARLRRTMLTPYLNGAVTIIAKASADGFAGVDIHDRAAANAFAETLAADTNNPDMARGIAVYLGAQTSTQLSKADRAWVIKRLTKRGFSVTTNLNEDGDVASLSVAFSYGWSEIEARDRERTDGNPVPPRFRYQSDAVSFSPPPPRFAVGTAVECQLRKGEWCPGEVVQIGWPEAMRDLGPVPEGGFDYICSAAVWKPRRLA